MKNTLIGAGIAMTSSGGTIIGLGRPEGGFLLVAGAVFAISGMNIKE